MKYLYLLSFFILTNCDSHQQFKEEQDILDEIKLKYKIKDSIAKNVYIVTGLDGCGACLEYTVNYINENSSNLNLIFILSGESKVKIKALFKNSTIERNNFYKDTLVIALRKGLVQQKNPKVFFLKEGLILNKCDLTSLNADSVFTSIRKFFIN